VATALTLIVIPVLYYMYLKTASAHSAKAPE